MAAPDDATSATRKPPPVAPIKYLEAGSRLFNSASPGEQSSSSWPPNTWRPPTATGTCSKADEQTMLDAYLKELAKAKAEMASASAGAEAPLQVRRPGARAAPRPQPTATAVDGSRALERWRPRRPRSDRLRPSMPGQPPLASPRSSRAALCRQVRRRPAQGRRGGRPQREEGALRRHARKGSRGNQESTTQSCRQSSTSPSKSTTSAAKAKLREARNAMNSRNFEQAESIALEVKSWGMSTAFSKIAPIRSRPPPVRCGAATRSAIRRGAISRASPSTTSWCRNLVSSPSAASLTRPRPRHVRLSA